MRWRACDLIDRLADDQRTALIFVDNHGHRRDYTFAEVTAFSARYAAVLRAFGVQDGERAYVRLSTTGKAIFTLLALERLGVIAEFDEAAAANASTVITNRVYRGAVDRARERFSAEARYLLIGEECEGWARLDTVAQVAVPSIEAASPVEDASYEGARENAETRLGAVSTDVVWYALQIGDRDWFDRAVAQPWLLGCSIVAHDRAFDARERLDLLRELDVTIVLQRAQEYRAELSLADSERFKLPRLRRCAVLDGGFDALLQEQWRESFGLALTPYGAA